MRTRFRAALATATAAVGLMAGSVVPAYAATGYDRCPKGKFCIFDGADGTGAMASYSAPQSRLGTWDNRAESIWNRTGYKNFCLSSLPDYKYVDPVHDVEVMARGLGDDQVNLAPYRDENSHLANNLSSFRRATLMRTCSGGPEYLPWTNPAGMVSRPAHAFGDLNGDGSADLLQRTFTGRLWFLRGDGSGRLISGGWNAMTALTRHGDFSGDGKEDLLARNGQGVLSLYAGDGKGGFAWRKTISTGWNAMTVIQAAGDLSGDGRMDLLARNKQGILSLYAGDGKGGFAWRKTISTGWNGMRSFAGMGDLTGDRHDDVLVSDSTGRLWLYPGNGRSGFAPRKQLGGSNWLTFPTLIGTGDLVGDSRPDLIGAQRGDDVGTIRIFSGQPGATLLDIGAFEALEHGDLLR